VAVIRLAGLFACIGVAVSCLLTAAWKATFLAELWTISDAVPGLMLVLWPASFGLMALQPGATAVDVMLIYSVLILINGACYGVIGLVVGLLIKLARTSS
jgi:hypothetical protein